MTSFSMSSILLLAMMSAMPNAERKIDFTPEQEKVARDAVYSNKPLLGTREKDQLRVLNIPVSLGKLYSTHPRPVIETLLLIIDGGRPRDSVLAAGYALELLQGPGVGVVCVEVFDEMTYDIVSKNWETTPRKHWGSKVREKLGEGVPGEKKP